MNKCIALILAGGLIAGALSLTAQQTYDKLFTSEGFPNATTQGTGAWNLDTSDGVLNFFQSGGIYVSTASVELAGWHAADFVVSTRFTANNLTGTPEEGTSNALTIGFGALSSASNFVTASGNSYYLVDWVFGGQIGASATASHENPHTGGFFGLRNRTHSGTDHLVDLAYDSFSVIPEPSSYALLAGLAVLGGALFLRRRKRNRPQAHLA